MLLELATCGKQAADTAPFVPQEPLAMRHPLSPAESLLLAGAAALALVGLFGPAVLQPGDYHHFAAQRSLAGAWLGLGVLLLGPVAAQIAAYALAKLLETGDALVFEWTGQWVPGHTLKHVIAAFPVIDTLRSSADSRQNAPVEITNRHAESTRHA
jgi:hypothetical protein